MREARAGHLSIAAAPANPLPSAASAAGAAQPGASPPGRKPGWSRLSVIAVVTGLAAVALGAWALLAAGDESSTSPPSGALALEKAVSILAGPSITRLPLSGSVGRLVLLVGQSGDGVLALNGLGAAPDGTIYQAWITLPHSGRTVPGARFDGSQRFVQLSHPVPPGARVSVTLERAGGVSKPTHPPRLSAVRAAAGSR